MSQTPEPVGEPGNIVRDETDAERERRTGLSSVRMTDDESKAVQKTPNRVSLDSILMKIEGEEYLHPASIPHMTICVLKLSNGFAVVGKSTPADAANYDPMLGNKFAKEDALRQIWVLEAYLLRENLAAKGLRVETPKPDVDDHSLDAGVPTEGDDAVSQ